MNVCEPIDFFACNAARGRQKVFVFGHQGKFVGLGGRINMRYKSGMGGTLLYSFAVVIDNRFHLSQTLDVIFLGFDLHDAPSLKRYIAISDGSLLPVLMVTMRS